MRLHKRFALGLAAVLLLSLCACARTNTPAVTATPSTTTTAPTTSTPPETTVPPTTEEPHIELTREVIFQMLDDATALLNGNETITLQANKYTRRYIFANKLQQTDYLSLTPDNVVTIQNAKDSDVFSELRFVILMTNLMEEFPDSYAEDNITGAWLMETRHIYQITFYTEYAAAGYASINDFVKDHYNGQLSHTSYFNLRYNGSYSIEELYYCYEDGMHKRVGSYPYHYNLYASEYEKYLQSKGEG